MNTVDNERKKKKKSLKLIQTIKEKNENRKK